MSIKNTLLAGAALTTIAAAPALAKDVPMFHVLALHAGTAVNKTQVHTPKGQNVTYTLSAYSTISTKADYGMSVPLSRTYYTFLSNSSLCMEPKKEKVTLSTTKTAYATLGTGTDTATLSGCSSPDTFYGDTYTLNTKKAKNKTDSFTSTLTAKFKNGSTKYNGKLILDVSVDITK
jgi:hypothetical protein